VRTCIACREPGERDDLVRLVASPEGQVVVDPRGRLPGRGAWLHPRRSCLDLLRKRRGVIERALGVSASVDDIEAQLREHVERALLDGLSMAAAAGALVGGRDLLEQALREGLVVEVAIASDAADRTIGALRQVAAEDVEFTELPIDREALGHRIGKGARAAVGIRRSRATEHLRRQLRRLRMLR